MFHIFHIISLFILSISFHISTWVFSIFFTNVS
jgi:hypothetical protein